jgi:hypothetical protein
MGMTTEQQETMTMTKADYDAAIKTARAEAMQDAACIVLRFKGWGLGWDACTEKVAKEILEAAE